MEVIREGLLANLEAPGLPDRPGPVTPTDGAPPLLELLPLPLRAPAVADDAMLAVEATDGRPSLRETSPLGAE